MWWQCQSRLERLLSLCATIVILVACGFAIVLVAMKYQRQDSSKVTVAAFTAVNNCEARESVCNTPGCVLAAAELLKNMDKKVDPCEDFYSFACGGFEAKTVLPEDQSKLDSFFLLENKITTQLRSLMEKPIKEDEIEPFKLVKKLYQSCVNTTRVEELGLEPLKEILQLFGGWPTVLGDKWNDTNFVWYEMIYTFQRAGYAFDPLIDVSVVTDLQNSSSHIIQLDQCKWDSPGRLYHIDDPEDTSVNPYLEYQISLAKLLGANEESARLQQTQALEFEIILSKISMYERERRDLLNLYNPMTIKELSANFPGIPWLEYINKILAPHHVLTEDERVNVAVPDYFEKLIYFLEKTPKRTLANYLIWRGLFDSVNYLNEAARNYNLIQFGVAKTAERKPRWKECTDLVSSRLLFAVGAMYVREHFDEDARQPVNEMVEDIRSIYSKIIDETEWMDNKTKTYARKKVAAMKAHIAYPDELLSNDKKLTDYYENLALNTNDYFKNVLNLSIFDANNNFKKLTKPTNKNDWTDSPASVNGYYESQQNSMTIPAGVIQGVFFGKERPAYLNYAAIGWTIGHEITHSFDNIGNLFCAEGNLVEWWEAETKKNYYKGVRCIINQYGNFSFPELGHNLDGSMTLAENIADNGGIKAAYRAYIKWAGRQKNGSENWDQVEKRLPGLSEYSVRQLFWIGAANIWCQKSLQEDLKFNVLHGIHPPSRIRILGSFLNMPQFASDFNCPVGSAMNSVQKCTVW